MIIVTGGAGFIGSCMVRTLNDTGISDILIVDNIASTEKWKNLLGKRFTDYIHKDRLPDMLPFLQDVTAVIHLGACSSTTEQNADYLIRNNTVYTRMLWNYCAEKNLPFIYASSAATYGDGSHGFDDEADIDVLKPLNAYGFSKQLFDLWAEHQAAVFPRQHVGLKFFNVYGPNEYCKGSMASMVYHGFRQIQKDSEIRLFRSARKDYPDGAQRRDFIYVKDVCSVIGWFLDHPDRSGLFNVGTGCSRSFHDLAMGVFSAAGVPPRIRYIDMPEDLKDTYQYETRAELSKLRRAGYTRPFFTLEEGIQDYVSGYLKSGLSRY